MNIALGWELLPWEKELELSFPEDPLPLDDGGGRGGEAAVSA